MAGDLDSEQLFQHTINTTKLVTTKTTQYNTKTTPKTIAKTALEHEQVEHENNLKNTNYVKYMTSSSASNFLLLSLELGRAMGCFTNIDVMGILKIC